jgi:hypothetical protein
MPFNKHSNLQGYHAALSPSSYHWINYSDDKLVDWWSNRLEASLGTRKHEWAKEAILLRQKQPDNGLTLSRYINDCIGFGMTPEVLLWYSDNVFGTTDAIRFDEKNLVLQIFDLKTGITKSSFNQLKVYVALFCLEYKIRPNTLKKIELRIYQYDDVAIMEPELHDIVFIMDRIITFDRLLEELNGESIS